MVDSGTDLVIFAHLGTYLGLIDNVLYPDEAARYMQLSSALFFKNG